MTTLTFRRVESATLDEMAFLSLPHAIYPPEYWTEDASEIQTLIAGTHPISSRHEFEAWVAYKGDEIVLRAALTWPHADDTCVYLGYFESLYNDFELFQAFMNHLDQVAKSRGAQRMIGPVQASFWVSYRMLLSGYEDTPFTGEPYNPPYYPVLWEAVGFELTERYLSNFFKRIEAVGPHQRLSKRYQQFLDKGLTFKDAKAKEWEAILPQVYQLLSELYKGFPLFETITYVEFKQIFKDYQQILDFTMVKLAYDQARLVGFVITVPDYGNLVYGSLNPLTLLRILRIRHKAERYTVMYLGVDEDYLGLGSALTHLIYQAIEKRSAYAVAGMIHHTKVTKNYLPDMQTKQHHYGIFERTLQ